MSKARSRRRSRRDKQQWTTDELNIWNQPGDKAKLLGEIEAGKKVVVTGREMWGRTEIVIKGESRWVTDGYLSDEKPPTLGGDCTNGTSVEPASATASRPSTTRSAPTSPRSASTARCAAVAATTAAAEPSTSW